MAFFIRSDGYEFQEKLGDDRGKILHVAAGHHEVLAMRRTNLAERLYRVTGADIYRDSLLAGLKPPTAQPVLNGGVIGQDTNIAIPYAGKIFWCWGDTAGNATWNFAVSCATSQPPNAGGLDPAVGVNLTYFTNANGLARPMLPLEGAGLVWIDGLLSARDGHGRERLLAHYTRQPGLEPPTECGIALFDDAVRQFHVLAQMPIRENCISAHPFHVVDKGKGYWYMVPQQRVPDDWRSVTDPKRYESFTCLEAGARYDKAHPKLERTASGALVCGWKQDTDWIGAADERDLVRRGLMRKSEARFALLDAESGAETDASPDSIAWNAYRKKWILLSEKVGNIYYSEADDPTGPWESARKILSHQAYNFYNVVQHSFFDQEGGRVIYFEGTYTSSFSDAKQETPRYNYNQIMYRLRLDDPRLH